VKAVKIGNSKRMTMPKKIVEYLKIEEDDTLEVTKELRLTRKRKKKK
jgi:antitoxin component of MazEF toxin-antitoxin module